MSKLLTVLAVLTLALVVASARKIPYRLSTGLPEHVEAIPQQSTNVSWTISTNSPLVSVSETLYGVFFEEINHAGVGGLYAEQINNANFESTATSDYDPWYAGPTPTGTTLSLFLNQDMPLNAYNPTNLQAMTMVNSGSGGMVSIINPGFWGINTQGVSSFTVSFWAYSSTITSAIVSFQSKDGKANYGQATITGITSTWSKVSTTVNVKATDAMAVFVLSFETTSAMDTINFDVFSVMPTGGWMGLPYIRPDLANYVAAMKPAFVRFPGGCYVEGDFLKDRFDWRRALGNQENRRGHYNLWGYYSEDGLGMFEYLSFVEKLTDVYGNPTKVIWVVNNGIAHGDSIPTPDIAGWVQDALDSIEFAQGATTTKFGALRAQMGHPQPFKIDHLAIGNEDCGKPYYDTNYAVFYNAITSAYPDIITIANCQNPGSGLSVQSWDYHVYQTSEWFFENQQTFDNMDHSAKAARIFNSEYAVTTGSGVRGNLNAALGEAAWMNGLERNSDLVTLASYAPLFVNDNDRKWSPDAINFNSNQAFGSPSYWNQVLYSNSFSGAVAGTVKTLSYKLDTSSCGKNCTISVAAAIATLNSLESKRLAANTVIVHKIVNYGSMPLTVAISLSGLPSNSSISNSLDVTYLTSKSPNDENNFQNPTLVSLQTTTISISKPTFDATFPAYSIFVVRAYATL